MSTLQFSHIMSKAIQPYLTCAWENFPNLSSQAKKKKKKTAGQKGNDAVQP